MGVDKALLRWDAEPQVRRVARLLELDAPPAYVYVRPARVSSASFAGLRLLHDQDPGVGPLEGLLSAFREASNCAWLAVAVDMPFLSERALRFLIDNRDPAAFATAYRNPEIDRPEPVCAIYEPRILPVLQKAKAETRYSLMLLRDVPTHLLEPERPEELQNINDPNEYRRLRRLSSPPAP